MKYASTIVKSFRVIFVLTLCVLTSFSCLELTFWLLLKSELSFERKMLEQKSVKGLFSPEQYWKFFEMSGDKAALATLSKDASTKFRSSFEAVQMIFEKELRTNGLAHLETLLQAMQAGEKTAKQTHVATFFSL